MSCDMRSADNSFTGDLVNLARFELSAGANFTFALGASGVNNAITGATALATMLNGVFELDDSAVDYAYGNSWQLVSAAATTYGATFSFDGFLNNAGVWRNGSYTFDQATGVLAVTPGSDLNSDSLVNIDDWSTFAANHFTDLSAYTP